MLQLNRFFQAVTRDEPEVSLFFITIYLSILLIISNRSIYLINFFYLICYPLYHFSVSIQLSIYLSRLLILH